MDYMEKRIENLEKEIKEIKKFVKNNKKKPVSFSGMAKTTLKKKKLEDEIKKAKFLK
ncbi:MAG: hypothetical protein HY514_05025 [Candidatus Aenigmarchaeota archaeon]|nr:hypothetical protein [Candidatus Aenigmarchaeota archaeon]